MTIEKVISQLKSTQTPPFSVKKKTRAKTSKCVRKPLPGTRVGDVLTGHTPLRALVKLIDFPEHQFMISSIRHALNPDSGFWEVVSITLFRESPFSEQEIFPHQFCKFEVSCLFFVVGQ